MPKHRNAARDRAIGARVCLARVRVQMSRPELGAKLGVSYQQVAKYEVGAVRLPASMLEDLAGALACDARSFIATDESAIVQLETIALPKEGSVARRQFERALDVLRGTGPRPFGGAEAGSGPS